MMSAKRNPRFFAFRSASSAFGLPTLFGYIAQSCSKASLGQFGSARALSERSERTSFFSSLGTREEEEV